MKYFAGVALGLLCCGTAQAQQSWRFDTTANHPTLSYGLPDGDGNGYVDAFFDCDRAKKSAGLTIVNGFKKNPAAAEALITFGATTIRAPGVIDIDDDSGSVGVRIVLGQAKANLLLRARQDVAVEFGAARVRKSFAGLGGKAGQFLKACGL